jgi:uncharacterized membrane protein YidH (DUF202 family)
MATTTVSSTELALKRTKFANERTYLAYLRTGLGIAAVAGAFKKWWVCGFGILMLLLSSIHFILTNVSLNKKDDPKNQVMEYLPLAYAILALGVLYMQWNKPLKSS